jgi:hypothetical protein
MNEIDVNMKIEKWTHIRIDVNTKAKLVNISEKTKIPISILVNILVDTYPKLVNMGFEFSKNHVNTC